MDGALVVPVILAGGSGTRLWPLSRERHPKQLLRPFGERSLLQETFERVRSLPLGAAPSGAEATLGETLVVCHEEHRFIVREQLEGSGGAPPTILLEPVARDTAPALTSAALWASRRGGDPVLLVCPSDHVVSDLPAFHRTVSAALRFGNEGMIVAFGVNPTLPETGYGYIRRGAGVSVKGDAHGYAIDAFVEKPGRDAAASYLASGRYLWNAGIFVMRASVWLEAVKRHRPEVLSACREALAGRLEDGVFVHLDAAALEGCPRDSIDYAVMERLSGSWLEPAADGREGEAIPATVVTLDAGWSDVGSWTAWLDLKRGDGDNASYGDVFVHDSTSCLLHAEHRLLAAVGLRDTVVVETADAVLVAHKDAARKTGEVVAWLESERREESRHHRRVERPWGSFERLGSDEGYQIKRLCVKPGEALSLQMHRHRFEHWVVVRGTGKVTRGGEEFLLSENQSIDIPAGTAHRLENPGSTPLEVIEVQSGRHLDEEDIVRYEDRYNRQAGGGAGRAQEP